MPFHVEIVAEDENALCQAVQVVHDKTHNPEVEACVCGECSGDATIFVSPDRSIEILFHEHDKRPAIRYCDDGTEDMPNRAARRSSRKRKAVKA